MKKIVLLIIMLSLVASCASTKRKLTNNSVVRIDSVKMESNKKTTKEVVIDSVKVESGRVTITEIVFYPNDSVNETSLNFGTIQINKSSVKSIKQTIVESIKEDTKRSKKSEEHKEKNRTSVLNKEEHRQNSFSEPVPDPYKWRYIFCIVLIAVSFLLYFKRMPIIESIRKIIARLIKV